MEKQNVQKMSTCLWFNDQAEDAAKYYVSVFKNSYLGKITRYGKEGFEIHGKPAGTVMVAEFELDGMKYIALNGGPLFKFSEAISIVVNCDTQDEIDHYWHKLSSGGEEGRCGWLKDRFGLSWQVVPSILGELLNHPDQKKAQKVTKAFLQMSKFDIEKLKAAFDS